MFFICYDWTKQAAYKIKQPEQPGEWWLQVLSKGLGDNCHGKREFESWEPYYWDLSQWSLSNELWQ